MTGRHPALITSERILDGRSRWHSLLTEEEMSAMRTAALAFERVAALMASASEPPPCGTRAAYQRHMRNREEPCDDCRAAKADAAAWYRHEQRQREARKAAGVA